MGCKQHRPLKYGVVLTESIGFAGLLARLTH